MLGSWQQQVYLPEWTKNINSLRVIKSIGKRDKGKGKQVTIAVLEKGKAPLGSEQPVTADEKAQQYLDNKLNVESPSGSDEQPD